MKFTQSSPKFTGAGRGALDFITEFQTLAISAQLTPMETFIALRLRIQDTALNWFDQLYPSHLKWNPTIRDLQELVAQFIRRFEGTSIQAAALAQINARFHRKNEDYAAYYSDILRFCRQADPRMEPGTVAHHIKRGLSAVDIRRLHNLFGNPTPEEIESQFNRWDSGNRMATTIYLNRSHSSDRQESPPHQQSPSYSGGSPQQSLTPQAHWTPRATSQGRGPRPRTEAEQDAYLTKKVAEAMKQLSVSAPEYSSPRSAPPPRPLYPNYQRSASQPRRSSTTPVVPPPSRARPFVPFRSAPPRGGEAPRGRSPYRSPGRGSAGQGRPRTGGPRPNNDPREGVNMVEMEELSYYDNESPGYPEMQYHDECDYEQEQNDYLIDEMDYEDTDPEVFAIIQELENRKGRPMLVSGRGGNRDSRDRRTSDPRDRRDGRPQENRGSRDQAQGARSDPRRSDPSHNQGPTQRAGQHALVTDANAAGNASSVPELKSLLNQAIATIKRQGEDNYRRSSDSDRQRSHSRDPRPTGNQSGCFSCHAPDHWIKECPHPRTDNRASTPVPNSSSANSPSTESSSASTKNGPSPRS